MACVDVADAVGLVAVELVADAERVRDVVAAAAAAAVELRQPVAVAAGPIDASRQRVVAVVADARNGAEDSINLVLNLMHRHPADYQLLN